VGCTGAAVEVATTGDFEPDDWGLIVESLTVVGIDTEVEVFVAPAVNVIEAGI
jgi:hypothetical protein